ncbi:polysaccharide deacetylase family protein [Rubellimicrobium rubrum]|nr:polysaccharide deacetylase family protein [Rubellimicrobium rubrum]
MGLSLLQRIEYRAGTVLPLSARTARSRRGILSVTFDDFPRSAWQVGGELLGAVDGRATYYVAGRFHDTAVDGAPYFTSRDLIDLVAAGHELGCHSFDHQSALKVRLSSYMASVRRNADFVSSILPGYHLRSHAFPYGQVRVANRLALRGKFAAQRGIETPRKLDRFDPTHLRAGALEARREGQIDWPRLIEEAARSGGWLVLFTHGLRSRPSPYDAQPKVLEGILRRAQNEGLEILPVGEALDRVQAGP